MKLKDVKRGDFFTKKPIEDPSPSQVWIKGEFDRSTRRYVCTRWDDISRSALIPGDREVFTEFTF